MPPAADPPAAPSRAQLLRALRERTGESLDRCRAALEASAGDLDAATAALRGPPAAGWFHGVLRDDRSLALILELSGSPTDEHRPALDALLDQALLATDDAALALALQHPSVQRFLAVRLPADRPGLCALQVGEKGAAAVVLATPTAEQASKDEAVAYAQELADRTVAASFRFANVADIPPAESAAWLLRARGVEADDKSLTRILVLSRVPDVTSRLKYGFGSDGALLALRRLDRGRDTTLDALRDVSPCFTPGPFAVAGRALSVRLTPTALADLSERVRRWGDEHGVAASFVAAGSSTSWHTLPGDAPLAVALVIGIVVARGDAAGVTAVDRKACLAALAALRKLPATAWADLGAALPDPERALLLAATDAVHVGAVGAVRTELVFGKKGTHTATLSMSSLGGGPFLEYYKSGPRNDHRASWAGVRGEPVASASFGTTAPATLEDDAAHTARAQRLPKMAYHLVPSCDVEVPELYR
jgi:hypothetical protein